MSNGTCSKCHVEAGFLRRVGPHRWCTSCYDDAEATLRARLGPGVRISVLMRAGLATAEQLAETSEAYLAGMKWLGPRTAARIRAAIPYTGNEPEIKRLRARLAESEAECDQWQKKLTDDAWPEIERLHGIEQKFNAYVQDTFRDAQRREAENERLRAEVDMWHRHYAGLLNEAHDENERLRAALAEACDEIESWVDSDDETTTAWRHLLARDMEC